MAENNLRLMFSMITGDIYTILEEELPVMDKFQVPLLGMPSSSCKKCYGRLYTGFHTGMRIHMLCPKCSNKYIDFTKYNDNVILESFAQ